MSAFRFGTRRHGRTRETRWRHAFTWLVVAVALGLIGWGGFVTSINAGMAVPDWPASFGSFDPFQTGFHDPADPAAQWWDRVPVLAEHGHRLLGMLVGTLTLILAAWTWFAEERRWMRWLGLGALVLVMFQGLLGGLRVVYNSMDLAVVHACTAQVFFSLTVALALFTSRGWMRSEGAAAAPGEEHPQRSFLRRLAVFTAAAVYGQIILGALLRHPGTGIDPLLAGIHMTGAFVVAGLIVATVWTARKHFRADRLLRRAAWCLGGVLAVQFVLGFTAYFVLLDEAGMLQPSNFQVAVNTAHLVVGTLLMASAAATALLALRRPARTSRAATAASPASALHASGR